MKPRPLLETVRSITTITSREVVQLGMISNIHIRAANTKMAIMRCWTTVRSAIPKVLTGRAHRRIVMISTMGRSTQYLTEKVLLDILSLLTIYLSLKKRRKFSQ